jgi:hypothetical protein
MWLAGASPRGQIEGFHTVHEMIDELGPVGTQDVFFCAWKQALDLVGDQVFWDAIEILAAELRHGEISRDEVARIANGGLWLERELRSR